MDFFFQFSFYKHSDNYMQNLYNKISLQLQNQVPKKWENTRRAVCTMLIWPLYVYVFMINSLLSWSHTIFSEGFLHRECIGIVLYRTPATVVSEVRTFIVNEAGNCREKKDGLMFKAIECCSGELDIMPASAAVLCWASHLNQNFHFVFLTFWNPTLRHLGTWFTEMLSTHNATEVDGHCGLNISSEKNQALGISYCIPQISGHFWQFWP